MTTEVLVEDSVVAKVWLASVRSTACDVVSEDSVSYAPEIELDVVSDEKVDSVVVVSAVVSVCTIADAVVVDCAVPDSEVVDAPVIKLPDPAEVDADV